MAPGNELVAGRGFNSMDHGLYLSEFIRARPLLGARHLQSEATLADFVYVFLCVSQND